MREEDNLVMRSMEEGRTITELEVEVFKGTERLIREMNLGCLIPRNVFQLVELMKEENKGYVPNAERIAKAKLELAQLGFNPNASDITLQNFKASLLQEEREGKTDQTLYRSKSTHYASYKTTSFQKSIQYAIQKASADYIPTNTRNTFASIRASWNTKMLHLIQDQGARPTSSHHLPLSTKSTHQRWWNGYIYIYIYNIHSDRKSVGDLEAPSEIGTTYSHRHMGSPEQSSLAQGLMRIIGAHVEQKNISKATHMTPLITEITSCVHDISQNYDLKQIWEILKHQIEDFYTQDSELTFKKYSEKDPELMNRIILKSCEYLEREFGKSRGQGKPELSTRAKYPYEEFVEERYNCEYEKLDSKVRAMRSGSGEYIYFRIYYYMRSGEWIKAAEFAKDNDCIFIADVLEQYIKEGRLNTNIIDDIMCKLNEMRSKKDDGKYPSKYNKYDVFEETIYIITTGCDLEPSDIIIGEDMEEYLWFYLRTCQFTSSSSSKARAPYCPLSLCTLHESLQEQGGEFYDNDLQYARALLLFGCYEQSIQHLHEKGELSSALHISIVLDELGLLFTQCKLGGGSRGQGSQWTQGSAPSRGNPDPDPDPDRFIQYTNQQTIIDISALISHFILPLKQNNILYSIFYLSLLPQPLFVKLASDLVVETEGISLLLGTHMDTHNIPQLFGEHLWTQIVTLTAHKYKKTRDYKEAVLLFHKIYNYGEVLGIMKEDGIMQLSHLFYLTQTEFEQRDSERSKIRNMGLSTYDLLPGVRKKPEYDQLYKSYSHIVSHPQYAKYFRDILLIDAVADYYNLLRKAKFDDALQVYIYIYIYSI